MFVSHTPQLLPFRLVRVHCELNPSWMSNLRELVLGKIFNNREVCDALVHLTRLEILILDDHTDCWVSTSTSYSSPQFALNITQCLPTFETLVSALIAQLAFRAYIDMHPVETTSSTQSTNS